MLLVELVDEVDKWRSTSEALSREVEALRSEKEKLIAERRVAETWRLGLAEELTDYGRQDPWSLSIKGLGPAERDPIRALLFAIPLATLLWGALIVLALLAYRLFTG